MPARRAASTFSLTPPIGSTRPVSVISPVMAVSLRAGSPCKRRQRRRHRHAGRRAVFRDRAGRDVDVHAAVFEHCRVDAQLLGVRPDVALGRPGRLLHHVAELAGQRQALAVRQQRRLDVETSPPASVQASPVATPAGELLPHLVRT